MNTQEKSPRNRKSFTCTATQLAGSVEEVAARLSLGRTTVYDLIGTGALKSIKVGRRRLIPETAIVTFLAELQELAS